jgi:hypothetical protein
LYGAYPTEFAGSTQNPKKNYRNTKSTKQNKNFPEKSMFMSFISMKIHHFGRPKHSSISAFPGLDRKKIYPQLIGI